MPEWKERAIILRIGHFRESDLWLRALLANRGLATLFAFGGAKSRRRFSGCLDLLNTLECRIRVSRSGEYAILQEAGLLASPRRLRTDWRAMGIAANCMRFIEACGVSPENAAESFALVSNLRETLEKAGQPPVQFPLFFRLRVAEILGYGPDFGSCASCGCSLADGGYFLPAEGQTVCADCNRTSAGRVRGLWLQQPCLDLLTRVRQSSPCAWSVEGISEPDLRQAARAIDGFTQFHLGLEWDNGNFRKI